MFRFQVAGMLVVAGLTIQAVQAQNVFMTRQAQLSFFSATPLEDISAKTNKGMSAIDTNAQSIYFKVDNTSFEFPLKLMQEHFNDNYMESAKYPYSEFKGKYAGVVDLANDGVYPVKVTGTLKMHGVERPCTYPASITIKNHQLSAASCVFDVLLKDFNIAIPTAVVAKIAEQVKVTINAEYTAK